MLSISINQRNQTNNAYSVKWIEFSSWVLLLLVCNCPQTSGKQMYATLENGAGYWITHWLYSAIDFVLLAGFNCLDLSADCCMMLCRYQTLPHPGRRIQIRWEAFSNSMCWQMVPSCCWLLKFLSLFTSRNSEKDMLLVQSCQYMATTPGSTPSAGASFCTPDSATPDLKTRQQSPQRAAHL